MGRRRIIESQFYRILPFLLLALARWREFHSCS